MGLGNCHSVLAHPSLFHLRLRPRCQNLLGRGEHDNEGNQDCEQVSTKSRVQSLEGYLRESPDLAERSEDQRPPV